jgi:Nuclease-related domain
MNESVVEVFLGDPIRDRGELYVLNRLRGDLQRRGVPARVFANFVAAGRQQRQIDLLVATPTRLVHAELKAVAPELPLVGDANGPWQQLLPDGQRRPLDPNPYRQAHQGTYAISDVMRKLARRNQIPEAAAFYKHIDTVVCLSPTIPAGSRFGPYKHVEVVGYDGLLARLVEAGPRPPWAGPHWEVFTRALGVYPQAEESAAERTRRADAAVVADYRRYFRGAQVTGLHELVAVPADVDGRQAPRLDLAGMATDQRIVVVLGLSGIGKTHTARHAAIELNDRGHAVVWLRCAEYEPGRFGHLLARAVAPFSTEPALGLMRKAVDAGSAVVVVLDGVNECPSTTFP